MFGQSCGSVIRCHRDDVTRGGPPARDVLRESLKRLLRMTAFLDFDAVMVGWDERPRRELFVQDGLHLSPQGYQIWSAIIRPYLMY